MDQTTASRKSIAVVEDEPVLRDITMTELEDCGFRVVGFASADSALPFLESHGDEFVMALTDVQMPGHLNGLNLVEILSRLWPSLGLLVTSGGALVDPSRLPPKVAFLAKPWRPADMAAQVRRIASRAA